MGEYCEGQWWLKELDAMAGTPDQRRAVAVVRKMMAEQHQGEPVALPVRMKTLIQADFADGWNACIDLIETLGPLYTHADPGEVGQLRKEIARLRLNISEMNEDARIRDGQIAERDVLLRDTKRCIERNDYPVFELLKRIDTALSASAEPSAPVERDERAEFEAWYQDAGGDRSLDKYNSGDYRNEFVQRYWVSWQARAALERNK